MAVPFGPARGKSAVTLPLPLTPSDAVLMRRILALQEDGKIAEAVRTLADLQDPLLLGTVLAGRYLGRFHRSTVDELTDWLNRYGDQPEASEVRALLLTRLPKGIAPPPAPATAAPATAAPAAPVSADADPATDSDGPARQPGRQPGLDRTVLDRALRGNSASALRLISATRGISPAYAAELKAEVAQILFTQNEDTEALRVARTALNDIPAADQPGLGFYIGGLAAWRLDRVDAARTLFEGGAKVATEPARLRAASAFWASRASRRMGDADATATWLHAAAEEGSTLHGLLARRVLRQDNGLAPDAEALGQADVDAVAGTPPGLRAFALLQIGQPARAEAELRLLLPDARANPAFARSLLLIATAARLTKCEAEMEAALQLEGGSGEDERLPMPRLQPAGGFRIDPSLVYALARVESNFDPAAISPAGARGLMQIMPATAQYIAGNTSYAAGRLHEPAFNLDIGQRYVSYLARLDGIDNDLLRVLASYNSGPGNFVRWGADVRDQGDPLLFIEAIPIAETRGFVRQALVYSWIYAARMHLPTPSLDALAASEFPRFSPARFTPSGAGRRMVPLSPEHD